MARGSLIQRLGQNRQPRRNAKNSQLVASLLDDGFVAPRFRRGLEYPVGRAGNILFGPEHSDVGFDLVVVRREIVVADRPVIAHAIVRLNVKVDRSEAQGDTPPVVRASAHDARSVPAKIGSGRGGVGFTFDRPGSRRSNELAFESVSRLECVAAHTRSAMRQIIGPDMFLKVVRGIQRRPRLQQRNI